MTRCHQCMQQKWVHCKKNLVPHCISHHQKYLFWPYFFTAAQTAQVAQPTFAIIKSNISTAFFWYPDYYFNRCSCLATKADNGAKNACPSELSVIITCLKSWTPSILHNAPHNRLIITRYSSYGIDLARAKARCDAPFKQAIWQARPSCLLKLSWTALLFMVKEEG